MKNLSFHVDTYSHLCDLPLAQMKSDGDVNVLIGQDCAEALIPLEIRKGATGEPFATRTLFGWSLNGPISNHDILNKQVIANCITTFSKENKLDCFWSMGNDETSESTVTLSPSENKVVALWNIQVRLVEGHPELPTPWIVEGQGMPTNITVAKYCLISTERSLQKKLLVKEYDGDIKKLLNKNYVEPHPDSDTEPDRDNTFYLPHHAVAKEAEHISVILDSANRVNNVSINYGFLQTADHSSYPTAVKSLMTSSFYIDDFLCSVRLIDHSQGMIDVTQSMLYQGQDTHPALTMEDMKGTEVLILLHVQAHHYKAEIHRLKRGNNLLHDSSIHKLSPYHR